MAGGTWGTVAPHMCQQLGAGTALAAPSSTILTHPFHSALERLLSHPVFTAQTHGVFRDLSRWHHPAGGTWWPAQVPRAAGISPGDAQVSGFRGNPCSHASAHGAEPTLSLSGLAAARGAHPRTPNPAHPPAAVAGLSLAKCVPAAGWRKRSRSRWRVSGSG